MKIRKRITFCLCLDAEFGSGSLVEALRCGLYSVAHVLLPLAIPVLPLLNYLSARLGCVHLAYLLELAHRPASASDLEPMSRLPASQSPPQDPVATGAETFEAPAHQLQPLPLPHDELAAVSVPLVVISKSERETRDRKAIASSTDAYAYANSNAESAAAARFELRAVLRKFFVGCFARSTGGDGEAPCSCAVGDTLGMPSANAIHVLGTVSSLCCLDKRGVLSGPMPTPERVILLRARKKQTATSPLGRMPPASHSHSPAMSRAPVGIGMGVQIGLGLKGRSASEIPSSSVLTAAAAAACTSASGARSSSMCGSGPGGGAGAPLVATSSSPIGTGAQTSILLLDLTHDHAARHGVSFDEPRWHRHLSQLKPLGLAILMNTCGARTSSQYMRFADHLSSVAALYANHEVAVVNRRCLCTLARLIGFTEGATNAFVPIHTIGLYRHALHSDDKEKERGGGSGGQPAASSGSPAHIPAAPQSPTPIRALRPLSARGSAVYAVAPPSNPLARICPQTPLANVFSVLARDRSTGLAHMFSQGTADVLLELCTDYWDGRTIVPLTPLDRRKLLDQYARLSAVAYCTAFAYRPALPDDLPTPADTTTTTTTAAAAAAATSAASCSSGVTQKQRRSTTTPEVCIELPADLSGLFSHIQRRFESEGSARVSSRMRHSVCTPTGSEFQQSDGAHSQAAAAGGEIGRCLELEQRQIFIGETLFCFYLSN